MADAFIAGTCVSCGTKFSAPATAAGKQVKCPKCHTAVLLPGDAPPVSASAPPPGPPPAPAAPQRTAAPTVGAVFGILFGLGLLTCGGCLGVGGSIVSYGSGKVEEAGKESAKSDTVAVWKCSKCGTEVSRSLGKPGDPCPMAPPPGKPDGEGETDDDSHDPRPACDGTLESFTRPKTETEKQMDKSLQDVGRSAKTATGLTAISGFGLLGSGLLALIAAIGVFKRRTWGRALSFGAALAGIVAAGVSIAASPGMLVLTLPLPLLYAVVTAATLLGASRAAQFR